LPLELSYGKAVKRNRVKRLIKENYRLNEDKFEIGNSIVFLVKRNADISSITFKDVEMDLLKIFERIGQE